MREVGFEPIRPTSAASDDLLLSHLRDGDMAFQWHQDTVELPEGAVLLARGDRVPVQAFRVGDRAWGVQFHFEVDREEIDWWVDVYRDKGGDIAREWGKSEAAVRDEVSLTISAGVAATKMVAKIASDLRKPDGLVVVPPGTTR